MLYIELLKYDSVLLWSVRTYVCPCMIELSQLIYIIHSQLHSLYSLFICPSLLSHTLLLGLLGSSYIFIFFSVCSCLFHDMFFSFFIATPQTRRYCHRNEEVGGYTERKWKEMRGLKMGRIEEWIKNETG